MIYQLKGFSPTIDKSCFIAPNATLIGEVNLAKDASIWFNVVIRADLAPINIGENSNIQDGTIMHVDEGHPLTVGDNVTVGHKVMLHGCAIGNNTLVGMNAVILNGAKIGDNCLIGANALVTENMEVPDGQLVLGSPAKVVKALDPKTKALFTKSALHYVDNANRYKDELTLIDR